MKHLLLRDAKSLHKWPKKKKPHQGAHTREVVSVLKTNISWLLHKDRGDQTTSIGVSKGVRS